MRWLVLGGGWVGAALASRHPEAIVTRRSPAAGTIAFALERPESWRDLPEADAILWTFATTDADAALKLRRERFATTPLVVLGSTSAYATSTEDELVTESTPLDRSQPRVVAEEALRETGATVLRLAGLWGPARDPVRWLVDGRIRNAAKRVNLAHLDDVLAAISMTIDRHLSGERVNVSDGEPRRWSEHLERLIAAGRLPAGFSVPSAPPGLDSKRVSNDRLRALLPADHRFTLLT